MYDNYVKKVVELIIFYYVNDKFFCFWLIPSLKRWNAGLKSNILPYFSLFIPNLMNFKGIFLENATFDHKFFDEHFYCI